MMLSGNIVAAKSNHHRLGVALLVAGCLASMSAVAIPQNQATITFSGLTGLDGTPFNSVYTEGAFSVNPTTSGWIQDQSIGNPVPAIAGTVTTATIEITEGGLANFLFNSVDLAGNGATYSITGDIGANPQFTFNSGVGTLSTGFTTINNPSSTLPINELFITLNAASPGVVGPLFLSKNFDVDNITVTLVPEPSVYALTGLAVAGLFFFRRRR